MDDIQNWRYEQEQEFQRFGSAANDAGIDPAFRQALEEKGIDVIITGESNE